MDLKDYCGSVEAELIGWKAKMYDIVRKIDQLGTEARGKMLANVEDLHIYISELEQRIQELRTECPTEWSPQKKAIDEAHVDMRSKFEETLTAIGKSSPVSIPG